MMVHQTSITEMCNDCGTAKELCVTFGNVSYVTSVMQ